MQRNLRGPASPATEMAISTSSDHTVFVISGALITDKPGFTGAGLTEMQRKWKTQNNHGKFDPRLQ
jgi:hypothetical protein